MLTQIEAFLTRWLGDPTGAHSWLELLSWIAALIIAALAAFSLRRQSLDGRASFLLSLYERWEALDASRKKFAVLSKEIRRATLAAHAELQEKHRAEHLRRAFLDKLQTLQTNDEEKLRDLLSVLTFFEVLGTYVRNRYLPIRDVGQLFKGPILEMEMVFRDFIDEWQKQAHMPPGLFTNALYLMRRTRRRENHPRLRWFL